MRIISQNRRFSFDFRTVIIHVDENVIFAITANNKFILGRYANEEVAKEIFEDIHDNFDIYGNGNLIYLMPPQEEH